MVIVGSSGGIPGMGVGMRIEKGFRLRVSGPLTPPQLKYVADEGMRRVIEILDGEGHPTDTYILSARWDDGEYVLEAKIDTWRD